MKSIIGLEVHQATIVVAAMDSTRKLSSHGIHPRDRSGDHSSVLCGIARNFVGDLRGKNLVGISPIEGAAIPDTPVLQFGRDSMVDEPVGDRNARRRDIQVGWNEQDGDLTLHAFYNAISKDDLNSALQQARKSGKVVRTMTVVLSVDARRESYGVFTKFSFDRDLGRERAGYLYWVKTMAYP